MRTRDLTPRRPWTENDLRQLREQTGADIQSLLRRALGLPVKGFALSARCDQAIDAAGLVRLSPINPPQSKAA